MPLVKFSPLFNDQTFIPATNTPASGYKLYTYASGSSAKLASYTDSSGNTAQTNPIILNSAGQPSNPIWLAAGLTYKFVLASPTDTDPPTSPLKTFDNISGINDTSASVSQWLSSGVTPTFVNATTFTVPGDQTGEFHVGRRAQFVVSAGNVYGTILTSTFGALTTVVMSMDAGNALDAGLLSVNLSIIRADKTALPPSLIGGVVGTMRNGRMIVAAASATATFTADEIIVETALGGAQIRLASFSKTINLATTGVGGMDTGAAPVSGYVALYAIYNMTTSTSALLAVNATSAAAPSIYGGANMPAGYTASGLISVWPTNASSLFVVGLQNDRKISFSLVSALSTTTPQASYTSLSISSSVPKNARYISGAVNLTVTSGNTLGVQIASTSTGIGYQLIQSATTGLSQIATPFSLDLSTDQTIFYTFAFTAGSAQTLTIYISQYSF